jgi:transcriptional regulator with XRE-family HTH domain
MFLCVREHPDQNLAALLKRLREDREVTQEELAFDAGITVSALSRIERGLNSPGWMTLKRIIGALGVSLMDLARELEVSPGADVLPPRRTRGS